MLLQRLNMLVMVLHLLFVGFDMRFARAREFLVHIEELFSKKIQDTYLVPFTLA